MALAALLQDNRTELDGATRLAIAGLVGLAVGIEREWSGHAAGPQGRFAGVRTFLLLGLVGGGAGLLSWWGYVLIGTTTLGVTALFIGVTYVMAVRRPNADLDGTTEAAALIVLTLGALAGVGEMALAGGAAALVVLALGEKEPLHRFVHRIGELEMRAALHFLVLAVVVLPLLPVGPYGPFGGIRPRALWTIVLVFSGLSFIGYLARRAVGPERGYGVTGMLGGIVSSTAVTLQFSRISKREPELGTSLALGAIAACTVLLPRVALMSALLNSSVAVALLPYLVPPLVMGVGMIAFMLRKPGVAVSPASAPSPQSPLRLRSAIELAVLFQFAMMAITIARETWGSPGVIGSSIALGVTDVDALTVSMSQLADGSSIAALAAKGIAIGILTNTVFKLLMAVSLGRGRFRGAMAAGLGALALAAVVGIWVAARL